MLLLFCPCKPHTDPVARHAKWVSSQALGTLLPHLQQSARDLLSHLVAARARIPTSSAATTAASPAAPTRPPSGSTHTAAGDRGCCACVPTAAERRSRDEGGRSGEARSRTDRFELQDRSEGQQQCAVCDGVPSSAGYSRGTRCDGGVGGGETGGAAAAAATVGPGVGHGVGEKSAASLEKECETLRIVVQALREKDEDSQASADICTGCDEVNVSREERGLGARGRRVKASQRKGTCFLVARSCLFFVGELMPVSCKLPGTMSRSLPITGDNSARKQFGKAQ